ncbi:YhdH/YhfP family quinone oxidoreductase [Verminephrobacter eiseniae]|uniref:Alcohol dehydrogenase GroES domain protein n=1 Tax=Verminephrobacter eiseniae (strain EF01-2) TaxID=391735 RepID=A1WKU2_VEREI|nr:YhdH/YhfP family quinone oxidoreductase [Verminephrobacter eiseniae]ABM58249.1 Alcohol dehydrogenase GroES domain protein [Verminephrobacter eiseniae EF01-2]MCW5258825.1 acryloyl-CoA reductase [Verminephrobacter eiseniae]MCW5283840.1 acryloyl-CoA reductase [Verminephrobacter eiseniae]MCW5301549.1 acryloyl-CoA reductase [Verminephrobacter eiseniae]MCW8180701.1 acryloyl-CoA reductase [Verminephrobacter eiseniae]
MTSFQALRLHDGKPEPARRIETLQPGDLSPGNVLIEVAYSSINHKDALAAHGRNGIIRQFPRIGGIDLTGCVAASDDARFTPGDEVIVHGFGIGVDHDGGHAQRARVPGDWVLPLPRGLTLLEAAILGAAGYTAGLALHWMEHNGLTPERGPVLVTGATGGVASIAIDMLAGRGYQVTAMTGNSDAHAALKALGASEVIGRIGSPASPKPLEKARWAGAVDSVGGQTLAWLTRTMQPEGIISAFGNIGGAELDLTVLPFILRGIRLIGIDANSPMPLRRQVWDKIARDYRPTRLERIGHCITLAQLPEYLGRMLQGQLQGRTVIRM